MKLLDILIIGAGLYVSGKGTQGYGTVLPAVFEWERVNRDIGNLHCASTSSDSSKELLAKFRELEVKTNIDISIKTYPETDSKNNEAYKEALKNCKKPACAIIVVPDHLHYKIAKDCLEAGVHTLIAKPLTPSYAEGEDLVNIAKNSRIYGAVEFHKRWDKSNILLRDKINSGILGKPLNCWIEYSQRRSIPISSFKDWASMTSVLQYLGVHYIDIIRFATSALPKRVMAIGQKSEIIKYDIDTYDAIQSIIDWEMPDGSKFTQTILTSWVDPENSTAMSDQKIKFIGTKGRYEADQKDRGIRINTDDLGVQDINPDFCMPYGTKTGNIRWRGYGIESITTFINDVVDLEKGRVSLSYLETERPSFQESLISTAVIEAAHLSLKDNSNWQQIDIFKNKIRN